MQVTETNAEGLRLDFTVTVPASDIETAIVTRLEEVKKTIRMPGFRPGKVPVSLLRKQYGQSVMGEILEKMVNESSQDIMKERDIRPAMMPKIEVTKFEEGSDLEYTMAVEKFPEFEPTDFSKLSLERLKVEIADSEIEEGLQRLADVNKETNAVTSNRKSKKGDFVVIDFVGSIDGEEFSGGKADDYQLELGSGQFIPGFEEQVIGAKAGDKLEAKVKFPDEYGSEDLAGKDAVFAVTVKELREGVPGKIDDDLAVKMGLENLDKLKEALKEEQGREYEGVSRMRMKKVLFDILIEKHGFDLPQGLVDQEFEGIWKQLQDTKENNPDQLDPSDKDKSDDELKEEYQALAQRRVRLALFLSEVGRLNDIEVTQDEINRGIMNEARRYPGQEKQVFEFYQSNQEARESLRGPLLEDKVVDYIVELAKVKDKVVSVEELMKDPDEDAKPKKKAAAKKPAAKKAPAKKPAAKKAAAKKEE
ncbi:MAG: trigger factor [Rhodospirillales bacterium]|nr:trigger factor [Rhodospirillales bacterium]